MRFSSSLMAAAFACGGALLAQVPAQAHPDSQASVPFEGGVLADCEEITLTAGELRPDGPDRISSDGPGGGSSAELDRFSCNTPAELVLDSITGAADNPVALSDLDCDVTVSGSVFAGAYGSGSCDSMPETSFGIIPPNAQVTDTSVDLMVHNPFEPLPAGDYSFTVNFNLIPN